VIDPLKQQMDLKHQELGQAFGEIPTIEDTQKKAAQMLRELADQIEKGKHKLLAVNTKWDFDDFPGFGLPPKPVGQTIELKFGT